MELIMLVYLLAIIAPISIFIHEFGHAIAAWLVGADRIYISIGTGKKGISFNFNKFYITLFPLFFLGGIALSERTPSYRPREKILISLFGPVMSGCVSVILWAIHQSHPNPFIHLSMLFNGWIALMNLLPFAYKGKQTDGYKMLQLVRKKKWINK
ncbi:M50 family metallopeptidase [Virgibacillus sp. AGTR]|uniref:M50 family metallopeptidase n=1 Tax=Virgibacillus sp. AGTR TaxID=2812055 RepID=UPI0019637F31|nr:M50 family metallopeptidase [Virgibacillus sp. AGTR]MCC2249127.1 M50 family metallopeptidase [Virgibacillus sp. AGTR]QRZ16965.1 M50 family metallopeptidase [Virgibacillus sp. AGTR]